MIVWSELKVVVQILVVNRTMSWKIGQEEKVRSQQSEETLAILDENKKLQQANEALKNINRIQGEKVTLLEEKVKKDDSLFKKMKKDLEGKERLVEDLRGLIEKDADKIAMLKADVKK